MQLSVDEFLVLFEYWGFPFKLTQLEARLMAKLDEALAAQTVAFADLSASFAAMEADLRAEHQQLLDALAALGEGGATPAQLAVLTDVTAKIGEMADRARLVVAETPAPQPDPVPDVPPVVVTDPQPDPQPDVPPVADPEPDPDPV